MGGLDVCLFNSHVSKELFFSATVIWTQQALPIFHISLRYYIGMTMASHGYHLRHKIYVLQKIEQPPS